MGHLLTEDLVVKIIARVPFPNILNCKRLSKRWYSRFHHDEGDDPYAKIFKDEVRSLSLKSWPSFVPLARTSGGRLHGFDSKLKKWNLVDNAGGGDDAILAGSLKFTVAAKNGESILRSNFEIALILRVENIISKSFKVIDVPALQWEKINDQDWYNSIIGEAFHVTSDGFVVAIFSVDANHEYWNENNKIFAIRLYDSKKANWEVRYDRDLIGFEDRLYNSYRFEVGPTCSPDAKILMIYNDIYPCVFARYDIVSGAWDIVQLFDIPSEWSQGLGSFRFHPVICGSRVIISGIRSLYQFGTHVIVLLYDESSRTVMRLNKQYFLNVELFPPDSVHFSGDEDHLYIGLNVQGRHSIHSFHLKERTWSSVPIPDENNRRIGDFTRVRRGSLDLGLSPFFRSIFAAGEGHFIYRDSVIISLRYLHHAFHVSFVERDVTEDLKFILGVYSFF